MAAPTTPQQKREQYEKQKERNKAKKREERRLELGLTAAEYAERLQDRRRKISATKSDHDRQIDQRVALWLQGERIASYLPTLQAQRDKLVADLQDLQDLIRDEEEALAEIRQRFT